MKQTFINTIRKTDRDWVRKGLKMVFDFETIYQQERMVDWVMSLQGKKVKTVLGKTQQKKSQNALGLYFGAVVPATAMDSKELYYDPSTIYEDWQEYKRQGKVSDTLFEAVDNMLRLEFHYGWTASLDKERVKYPKALSDKDNQELLALIERVLNWRNENGYPFIDIEDYKRIRDGVYDTKRTYS